MSSEDHSERPWLLDLATPQRGDVEAIDGAAYDETTQMTRLQEPDMALIDTNYAGHTKKADREVGEDQK
ncbi:MAG TPA: hypothetical protein VF587_06020 [Solirubrobacteraceae bacterium]|jgi:hypothetical protein